jgi:hypothetical protein
MVHSLKLHGTREFLSIQGHTRSYDLFFGVPLTAFNYSQ